MATTTTNVEQVKLNVMTQAQYDAATKSATELYMITDAKIDGLPDQTGQSGKYLTTDGTVASWAATVTTVEAGTTANKINVTKGGSTSTITVNNVANATTASKLGSTTVGGVTQPIYLDSGTPTALSYTIAKSVPADALFTDHQYTNGAGISLSGNTFSANCDTTTVSTNSNNKLQALGVIDKKTNAAVYTWKGTKAQYEALGTYNNNWIYYLTDDGMPADSSYYTKAQIDTMLAANHTITQDTAKVILKDTNTNANAATTPTLDHNGGLVQFQDKNGVTSGYLYTSYKATGDIEQVLESDRVVDGTTITNSISVGIAADGTKYTKAPTPAASNSISDTNIATVGWINDTTKSTGIVHTSGTETIAGTKTFSGNNVFNGVDTFTNSTEFTGNPKFISNNTEAFTVKNVNDIYNVPPAETLSTNISLRDKNGEVVGGWEHYHQADGTCINQMTVRQQGDNNYSTISVGINTDGDAWCNLPTDTHGTYFHGISTRAEWADLAERYESDEVYPAGTLIRFGGKKDITIADINCNGVISDKPGYLLDADLKNGLPIALVGKTPIRVIGSIKKFDRIVLSHIPGVGKAQVTSDEKVIAIALENNADTDEKLVMCVTKFTLD